ncbi:hypothetical protein BDP27DRAFT_1367932 [Rhodocollybia butyracea]|uniref:receptor protein-tyrosine kinase n=1 Tax=Rhodocollybia butyracea TaxID=206335 RepID=A0A9P5PK90_9AGAR|nr:hypothetical protein BDP27DRAFT_1367932 [Rhodocollybia butyracea]
MERRHTTIPTNSNITSDLGNTQSHTFTPDSAQVLAGDQFTFTIEDSDGNSTMIEFASCKSSFYRNFAHELTPLEATAGCAGNDTTAGTSSSTTKITTTSASQKSSSTTSLPSTTHSVSSSTTHSVSSTTHSVSSTTHSIPSSTAHSVSSTTHSVPSSTIHSLNTHTTAIAGSPLLSSRSSTSSSSNIASPTLRPTSSSLQPAPSSISAISHRPSSNGALIGGIIGALLLLALLSLAAFWYTRRKLHAKKLALRRLATLTPVPFTAVSGTPVSGSALMLSPESRKNSNLKAELQHPIDASGTVIFEERLGGDERMRESVVPVISFEYDLELEPMDIMTMRRRIDLLLAENARLTGSIPPPSYPGSATAVDHV